MPVQLPRSWKEEFAQAALNRREDIRHRERLALADAQARARTAEAVSQQKRRELEAAALQSALAPLPRAAEFRTRLDTYDAKTVEALIENQQAIDAIRGQIDDMLGKAHVLPDGRRVFKTTDGQKVFDEHGQELSSELIDPRHIDDKKPKWEAFKEVTLERARLAQEREQLLDYQAKLDQTRERLDKSEITNGDLDELERTLKDDMPDPIRRKVGMKEAEPGNDFDSEAVAGMDRMMERTGLGPAPAPR